MKELSQSRKNVVIGIALLLVLISGFAFGVSRVRRAGQTDRGAEAQPQRPNPEAAAEVRNGDNVIGDADSAELILINYSDMNCKFCGQFHFTMGEIAEEYGDRIAWVYRHFPLLGSTQEAMAAECAGRVGGAAKFWEYLDAYYQKPLPSAENKLPGLVELGRENEVEIEECLNSEQTAAKVQADEENAGEIGLQGTPSTILVFPETGEHEVLSGAYSTEDMRDILDSYLQ